MVQLHLFYLIFLASYLSNVRLFTLQEPIRFGAPASGAAARKKGHNTKKKLKNALFLRLFPKRSFFSARYETNIYNFCSNISALCEKKNRHFVQYKSRKLREKKLKNALIWSQTLADREQQQLLALQKDDKKLEFLCLLQKMVVVLSWERTGCTLLYFTEKIDNFEARTERVNFCLFQSNSVFT